MPRVSNELTATFWEPQAVGPVAQADLTAVLAMPATLPAGGSYTTSPLYADGFKVIAAAVTSDQAGTLSVSRFLDTAGRVPQGPASSVNLTAGVSGGVNVTDGLPFQAFTVTITNSSGVVANLTAAGLLLNAN